MCIRDRQYVLGHLADDLGVDALAAVANMSRRNFSRVFLRDAGVTPADFVEGVRVDAARARLERASVPLKLSLIHILTTPVPPTPAMNTP